MAKLNDFLISSKDHHTMCTNYESNQMKVINNKYHGVDDRDFHETKLVWYPLEIIEEYIQFIKGQVNAKSGKAVSGIAIYLTAHDDKGPENALGDYSRRMTVNLVPTINTNNLEHYVEPESSDYNGFEHKPVIIGRKQVEGELEDEKLHIINNLCEFNDIENINMVLDRGNSIPPPPHNG